MTLAADILKLAAQLRTELAAHPEYQFGLRSITVTGKGAMSIQPKSDPKKKPVTPIEMSNPSDIGRRVLAFVRRHHPDATGAIVKFRGATGKFTVLCVDKHGKPYYSQRYLPRPPEGFKDLATG